MFFRTKKIRELMKKLESRKMPQDLHDVVNHIEELAPDAPRAAFQKDLRKQLMLHHRKVAQKGKTSQKAGKGFSFPRFTSPLRPWSYAVAVVLIVLVAGVVSYPFIPAPQVVGYTLKENVRLISYNAPIKVVFNQPMDQGSVEEAFHIEPRAAGKIEWVGNTLLFFPEQGFNVGDQYAVYVEKEARSLLQKQMTFDYEETFEITGPPQVLLFNPAPDSLEVPVDAKLTVLFDRSMTPLKSLDEGEASFPEMKIFPPLKGRMKWLGTDSFSFIPEHLAYSTEYTVTIPKGTVSGEGGTTDQEFSFSFTTVKPRLENTNPYDKSRFNGPETSLELRFNQPMNLKEAKEKIHFYRFAQGGDTSSMLDRGGRSLWDGFIPEQWEAVDFSVRYMEKKDVKETEVDEVFWDYSQPVEPDPEDLLKTLVVTPTNQLPFDSLYLVSVDADLSGAEGEFTLADTSAFAFKTVGPVSVASTTPPNGTNMETSPDPATGKKYSGGFYWAEIVFSHPMDPEGIEERVRVSPEKKDPDTNEPVKPSVSFSYDNTVLSIRYDFEPSTDYTIGVRSGQPDQFGQKQEQDFEYSFRTPALDPGFQLMRGDDLSILDIHKDPVYYVKHTNIDTLNFRFQELNEEQLRALYRRGYLDYSAAENLEGDFVSWSKKVEDTFNATIHTKLDLSEELGRELGAGVYYMELSSPGATYGANNTPVLERQMFVVTDTALAVKRSKDELLVWATALDTGAPVTGLDVSVESSNGKDTFSGTTDKQGLVSFSLPESPDDYYSTEYTIFGRSDGGFTIAHSGWSEGIAPWNFNLDFSPVESQYYVYSYTDRPIYRPGHTVYFKGLVRKDMDARFQLPADTEVHVEVTDSRGEKVYEKDLPLNDNGTFNDQLTLSENVRTGTYTLATSLPDAPGPAYLNEFYSTFRIAEYRKPDYQLTLEPDKEHFVHGDRARVKVRGSFFFGAPLQDGEIEWTVKSQDYFFFIPYDSASRFASQWFSFSDDGYFCFWGCEPGSSVVLSGRAKLDDKGEYTIDLPLDISEKDVSQFYTVEVTAFDANNQSVSNRVTLPVHKGEYYMGIMSEDYVVNQGDPAKFEVISVDYDGMPLADKAAEVTFYKRNWNTIKKKNVDGGFYYENSYEDTLVDRKTIKTDNNGFARVEFVPKDGGNFKAAVTSFDSRSNAVSASTTVYVSSADFINWGRENNDRIELVPDKLSYKTGETAKILVKSPYQNVWALVTQERQGILDTRVVKIESNSQTIEVPITDNSVPNLFVSVVLVKGSGSEAGLVEPPLGSNDERPVAAFKVGYATLQVDNESKQLRIDVSTDRERYSPRDKVTVKLKTLDQSGGPQRAEVSVSVVDKSVLSLTENVTADLLNAFYRKRMLGVATAHTLTKAISRVNVQVEAGLKGGGGADREKRGLFKDTAHWEAVIQTDENGDGVATFELPDNLTTWEILAIGITDDTLVGSQKHEFLVSKDVLIRPVLPRFLIANDELKVGGIIHNETDRDMSFDVALEARGVDVAGDARKKVSIKAGAEQQVEWNISVRNETEAVFTFDVQAVGEEFMGDVLEQRLPIHPFSFPEVVATSQTITDNTKHVETVWLPLGTDQNFGELTVSVSPTLTGSIAKGLEYLMRFPYGCVEQTTSALLPNLVLEQLLSLPTVDDDLVDKKQLAANVEAGLQSLYKYQNANGGWGLWETSEPTPYLSAYVLYTLNEARKAGHAVDENVLSRGASYLTSYMASHALLTPLAPDADFDKYQARYAANSRAYALYVLGELGQGDLALTNNLFESRDLLSLSSQAYLAMTYYRLGDNETKVNALKNGILNLAKETPRGVHFEEPDGIRQFFDTDTRTTALVLQMLSRIDAAHPYVPKILRHLMLEKRDGHFASTQDTAVSLIAMIEYLKTSGELEADYAASVTLNGIEKLSQRFSAENLTEQVSITLPLTELQPNNADNEIAFAKDGQGTMYVDMNLRYFIPTEEVEPRNEGIVVTHEYFALDDEKMTQPLERVKLGDNVKAKVTLVVPEDRYYVMVEDFLPAGLEGIDFSLKTSQQSLRENEYDRGFSWYFNHSEVRDDRMMYFADFLPKGVYEIEYFVRATTPGTFHDLPVLAQELYFPEVFGRSEGNILTVFE